MIRTSRHILWTAATLLIVLTTAASLPAADEVTLRQGETWRVFDAAGTETARFTVKMVDQAAGAAAYTSFDLAAGTEGAATETTIAETKKAIESAMAGAGSVQRGYYLDQNYVTFAAAEPFEVPEVVESPDGEQDGASGGPGAAPGGGPGGPGGGPGGPGGGLGGPGAGPGGGPGGPGGPGGEAPEEAKSGLPLPILGGIGLVILAAIVFVIVKVVGKRKPAADDSTQ